jgi:histidinol-phosphate/aromatic aminotransferase/cobyric acid decarboxylase-like protein
MPTQILGLDTSTTEIDISPSMTNLNASHKTIIPIPKVAEAQMEARIWNTKNLGLRLASDCASSFLAASVVAPAITIIDKFVFLPSPQNPILQFIEQ